MLLRTKTNEDVFRKEFWKIFIKYKRKQMKNLSETKENEKGTESS